MNNPIEPPCNCGACIVNLEGGCAFDWTPEDCDTGVITKERMKATLTQELAIMKNVTIGMGDRGEPGLMFECVQEDCGAGQFLPWDKTGQLFKDSGFSCVTRFEGKPCIVEKSGNGGMSNTMIFQRLANV